MFKALSLCAHRLQQGLGAFLRL